MLRPQFFLFMGISILSITSTIAVQAKIEPLQIMNTSAQVNNTASSHTIRGKLIAYGTDTTSVACNQIKVKAEIWHNVTGGAAIPKVELASTNAQGSILGDGCTYSLTFNYSPSLELPKSSEYRVSAETPTIKSQFGDFSAGYSNVISNPFPEQFDMTI
ncbi:hypothetical protein [Nostoc sp. TCL26-01]|uniref:hypothetical protein n=1 Tax=Nostoc sp. TCL26-01 TaxID=2576904 RepID=UPI0015C02028|nr:hypothetical protein [Nostoc sp. TCL26-01]QLE57229.1 hypothetical protein FD725_17900 [Nostoc sp. TCL26-01]